MTSIASTAGRISLNHVIEASLIERFSSGRFVVVADLRVTHVVVADRIVGLYGRVPLAKVDGTAIDVYVSISQIRVPDGMSLPRGSVVSVELELSVYKNRTGAYCANHYSSRILAMQERRG
jgi:hypothetical protein